MWMALRVLWLLSSRSNCVHLAISVAYSSHRSRSTTITHPAPGPYILTEVERNTVIPVDLFPRKLLEDEAKDVAAILNQLHLTGSDAPDDIKLISTILLQALQQRVEYSENERKVGHARHYPDHRVCDE